MVDLPPNVTLNVEPGAVDATVGDVFTMDLTMAGAGVDVDTLSIYLNFDAATLAIVDAAGNPVNQVMVGPSFPAPLVNQVSNVSGTINLVISLPEACRSTIRGPWPRCASRPSSPQPRPCTGIL